MSERLAVIYLIVLLALLGGAAWFILRQVLKTRSSETDLSKLETKLREGRGTAEEHYDLASIYLRKKVFNQAIAQLQKALKAKEIGNLEDTARIYNALGFAYAAQEQYDLAIRQYKEALKQNPSYVTALNNLGFAYEKKQLITQALGTYEEALRIDETNSTAKQRANALRKRVTPTSSNATKP